MIPARGTITGTMTIDQLVNQYVLQEMAKESERREGIAEHLRRIRPRPLDCGGARQT